MRTWRCNICGKKEKSEIDWDIYHRGCRLQAAGLITKDKKLTKKFGLEGSGIAVFNINRTPKKIRKMKK